MNCYLYSCILFCLHIFMVVILESSTCAMFTVVALSDFPDTETVRCRLRLFENCFLTALTRRHASLSSVSARLGIVSFAIHLQSRPRRTVSLLQYLVSGVAGSTSTIPRQLLDPHGDNDGEYIVTVPDGLFHAAMCARDAAAAENDQATTRTRHERTSVVGTAEVDCLSDVDDDLVGAWLLLAEQMVKCAGREAARELARMFEYQIALLSEDRALRLLAEHAVECAAAYVDHQRGVWERNSLVRGAVFGAVFGHTETVMASQHQQQQQGGADEAAERRASRRVSVIVGHRELKWDIGDVLKRPGLRRDRLLYGVGTAAASQPVPPATFSYHTSTMCIDTTPSRASESSRRRGSLDVLSSAPDAGGCPWSFHVSAACDAGLYGYRGVLLDWDYFASAYAPVADDDGWFNEDPTASARAVDDIHRNYRPYRCLVGTELMQAYCAAASTSDQRAPTLAEFVRTRLNVELWARDAVEPVYRPLKALSLGRMRRADFAGTDLTRVGLTGVDLRRTGLRGCVLAQGRLTAARLGPAEACHGVDVSYASLVDAEFDADLLRSPAVTAQFAVVGVRSLTPPTAVSVPPPTRSTGSELNDVAVDEDVCIDDITEMSACDNHQLLVTATDGSVVPCTDSKLLLFCSPVAHTYLALRSSSPYQDNGQQEFAICACL